MSNQITISLDDFTQALRDASQTVLPWVTLVPTNTTPSDETIRPTLADKVPTVMSDFQLVPDTSYQFTYAQVLYVRLHYILERNGQFEVGVLHLIQNNSGSLVTSVSSEVSRPSLATANFTAPIFYIQRDMIYRTGSDLGVSFNILHNSDSSGEKPKFGLAFKITSATPTAFPRLAASLSAAFSPPT